MRLLRIQVRWVCSSREVTATKSWGAPGIFSTQTWPRAAFQPVHVQVGVPAHHKAPIRKRASSPVVDHVHLFLPVQDHDLIVRAALPGNVANDVAHPDVGVAPVRVEDIDHQASQANHDEQGAGAGDGLALLGNGASGRTGPPGQRQQPGR